MNNLTLTKTLKISLAIICGLLGLFLIVVVVIVHVALIWALLFYKPAIPIIPPLWPPRL